MTLRHVAASIVVQAQEGPPTLRELIAEEPGFLLLAAGIGLLVLMGIGFAIIASALRYQNRRKAEAWGDREQRWEGPVLSAVAGDVPPKETWALVDESEEAYFVEYLLRFARRTRGAARERLTTLARPYLDAVVVTLEEGDPEARAAAVEKLALLDFERYSDVLLRALSDEAALVKMVAARSIARRQDPEHMPLLLAHLSQLESWSSRQLSSLLAGMGAAAAPGMRSVLADDSWEPELRAVAADALRRLRDPNAPKVAAGVLRSARNRELVAASLRLLGALEQSEYADQIRTFCMCEDPLIQGAALEALAATGSAEDQWLFVSAMEHASTWIAIQGARGLAQLGGLEQLKELSDSGHPRSTLARQVLVEQG